MFEVYSDGRCGRAGAIIVNWPRMLVFGPDSEALLTSRGEILDPAQVHVRYHRSPWPNLVVFLMTYRPGAFGKHGS